MAPRVDALYFFLIAISAFFGLLIATLVVVFAVRYRRRSPDERPAAILGSVALELTWSLIPLGIVLVIFLWSAEIFFSMVRVPPGAMDVYVVGKRWMWKAQHMTGQREINELHVPVGRAGEDHAGLGGRDPQLLHPRLPREERRDPRALPDHVVRGHQAGALPPLLRRVLRHQALGDDRVDRGHGAGGLPGLAAGRDGRGLDGGGGGAPVPGARLRDLPPRRHRGARPQSPGPLRAARPARRGRDGPRRRRLHPRVDREPGGEGGGRVPADHARVPGAGDGGGPDAPGRLRPVARRQRGGAGRRRPAPAASPAPSPAPEGRKP